MQHAHGVYGHGDGRCHFLGFFYGERVKREGSGLVWGVSGSGIALSAVVSHRFNLIHCLSAFRFLRIRCPAKRSRDLFLSPGRVTTLSTPPVGHVWWRRPTCHHHSLQRCLQHRGSPTGAGRWCGSVCHGTRQAAPPESARCFQRWCIQSVNKWDCVFEKNTLLKKKLNSLSIKDDALTPRKVFNYLHAFHDTFNSALKLNYWWQVNVIYFTFLCK